VLLVQWFLGMTFSVVNLDTVASQVR